MSGFGTTAFAERWGRFSLMEQLGNIGSEVDRAIAWKRKGNDKLADAAFDRSLELMDLSISDSRWRGGTLKELTRVREVLCDTFLGDNSYNTPPESLSKYFYAFAVAAQRKKS